MREVSDQDLAYVERNKEDLLSRLKKIEGQIRGIQKMIEEDRYCVDILLQISATRAALQKVALSLLRSHTRGCVAQAIRQNRGDEAIDELMQVLDQFTK
ncbi:metal-sensitive transcriptional regulator [Desulfofundulus salinum]|uniref:Transcriptional regulator n=1 Tax=Desulfofundulus salinus TaxID=2419843 RepID=A0A494WTV9_9FIRM|nr:transcriptional regulator [Desulfofundulus salinum]